MSDSGNRDNGNFADLFFASILNPEANVRALTAIQAEGFRAASELVDRFVRMAGANGGANGTSSGTTSGTTSGVDSPRAPSGREPKQEGNSGGDGGVIEPLLRSWLAVTDQFLRGSTRAVETGEDDSATLDLAELHAQGALDLEAGSPGCARGEVWLHNRGSGDLGDVRLRCSELLAHDGHVISSAAIQFEPEVVPMPGRCSRGVTIKVLVGQNVPIARYCGTLLAEGFPDLSLPVVVTVRPPAS